MSVTVREASPADLDAIVDVNRRAAMVAYAHIFRDEPFPLEAVHQCFAEMLKTSEWRVLLAEEGGSPVGIVYAREGMVAGLYVVPGGWGRGIGALLSARAEQIAGDSASLWVLEQIARGREFWERRGWVWNGGVQVEDGAIELHYLKESAL